MIRRMLMFLLVACLALPATASPLLCVEQAEPAATMHGGVHDTHQTPEKAPERPLAQHDCVGCIAPFAGTGPIAAPGWFAPAPAPSHSDLLIARQASGPDTPPPRA